jgi:hypothetical protein
MIALDAADERKPCMPETNEALHVGALQETNSGPVTSYDRGQRSRSTPGELELAGRHKTLLCSCSRNQVGMQTCPEVLKERLNVDFPELNRVPIGEPIPRRVHYNSCQQVQRRQLKQVQRRHLKQVQQWYLIYASRSSREGVANACMKSTMCPKTNRL